jgi:isoleucyl-tRNA synthetase
MDLHRPWIDKVRVACPTRGCGGVMKRVPDVLDVWFDSAVASWASLGYPSHKKEFETLFPAQWIVEGLDQTRGWFYSQLAAGVASMDRVPYERVVMHGWVNDAQGRPMSKSLGNIVQPTEVVQQFGCDAFRMGLVAGAAPWEDVSFGTENVRNAQRSLNILWNVHVFATQYMSADRYRFERDAHLASAQRPEDRWLLSRLQSTIAETTQHFESYEFHRAAREVERFVLEDLSRWYVRLVRERVWDEEASAEKTAAYAVLYETLCVTAKLLAPFAPHVAEAIFQDLTEGQGREATTVHAEDWPVADAALTDYDLERDMATVRAVVDAASYARQKANMKLRWPVAKLEIASDDADVRSAVQRFRALVLEQANAKDIELVTGEWEKLQLVAAPHKAAIGKEMRAQGPALIAALQAMRPEDVRRMRHEHAAGRIFTLQGMTVRSDFVQGYETRLPEHTSGADFPGGSVYVDTVVTPELEAEGAARDLTRRIQEMRKGLGLDMGATIRTQVAAPPEFAALVAPHAARVAEDTRSVALQFIAKPRGDAVREWDLEGTTVTIAIAPSSAAAVAPAKERPPARPAEAAPPKRASKKAAPKKAAKKPKPKRALKAKPKKPAAKKAKAKKPAAKAKRRG